LVIDHRDGQEEIIMVSMKNGALQVFDRNGTKLLPDFYSQPGDTFVTEPVRLWNGQIVVGSAYGNLYYFHLDGRPYNENGKHKIRSVGGGITAEVAVLPKQVGRNGNIIPESLVVCTYEKSSADSSPNFRVKFVQDGADTFFPLSDISEVRPSLVPGIGAMVCDRVGCINVVRADGTVQYQLPKSTGRLACPPLVLDERQFILAFEDGGVQARDIDGSLNFAFTLPPDAEGVPAFVVEMTTFVDELTSHHIAVLLCNDNKMRFLDVVTGTSVGTLDIGDGPYLQPEVLENGDVLVAVRNELFAVRRSTKRMRKAKTVQAGRG
jgi:hypothetical protein